MKRLALLALLAGCGGHTITARPLVLASLHDAVDAAADRTRVIALFSPG